MDGLDGSATANVTLVVDRDEHRGLNLALRLALESTTIFPEPEPVLGTRSHTSSESDDGGEAVLSSTTTETTVTVLTLQGSLVSGKQTHPNVTIIELDEDDYDEGMLFETVRAIPSDVLILHNMSKLQEYITKFSKNCGFSDILCVTAYPTYKPGFNTIVANPTANKFTWSSLYRTLLDAAGTNEELLSHSPSDFAEVAESLQDGDVMMCRTDDSTALPRWEVTTQQIASR